MSQTPYEMVAIGGSAAQLIAKALDEWLLGAERHWSANDLATIREVAAALRQNGGAAVAEPAR